MERSTTYSTDKIMEGITLAVQLGRAWGLLPRGKEDTCLGLVLSSIIELIEKGQICTVYIVVKWASRAVVG